MEFRFRAGENRDPSFLSSSSSSSHGYFTSHALRAGFAGTGGDIVRSDLSLNRISAREILHRELQKERIREEIIVREIANKRFIEEEVRREMEVERVMAIRRFQADRVASLMQFAPEGKVEERSGLGLETNLSDVSVDQRLPLSVLPIARVAKKLPLPHHMTDHRPVKSSPLAKAKLSNVEVSGTKRKQMAIMESGELPLSAQKVWTCTLCQVSATSMDGLDDHYQGKKHKSKEALVVSINKVASANINGSTSIPEEADKHVQAKNMAPSGLKKAKIMGNKNQPKGRGSKPTQKRLNTKVVKNSSRLRCRVCNVQCNSLSMLNSHLRGKRHQANHESKNDSKLLTTIEAGTEKGKEERNLTTKVVERNKENAEGDVATARVELVLAKPGCKEVAALEATEASSEDLAHS